MRANIDAVIEVLRCAVDCGGIFGAVSRMYAPLAPHSGWLIGKPRALWAMATSARAAVHAEERWFDYDHECLEVAQRLEEQRGAR